LELPVGCVDAGGWSGLGDPPVAGEADQGEAGGVAAYAGEVGEPADVDLDVRGDGGEGLVAQHVEDAAVGRAAALCPPAG
jgi:hypothetical protein